MQITTRHTTITTHTPTPARVLATQELAGGGGNPCIYVLAHTYLPTYIVLHMSARPPVAQVLASLLSDGSFIIIRATTHSLRSFSFLPSIFFLVF